MRVIEGLSESTTEEIMALSILKLDDRSIFKDPVTRMQNLCDFNEYCSGQFHNSSKLTCIHLLFLEDILSDKGCNELEDTYLTFEECMQGDEIIKHF